MAYVKVQCPECRQPCMSSAGIVLDHPIRGTVQLCDGSGEAVEAESASDEQAPAAEVASPQTTTHDEQSSATEEKVMPEKIPVDLNRLEELAAQGATKSRAAQEFGMNPTTFSSRLKDEEFRAAWERGVERFQESQSAQGSDGENPKTTRRKTGARKASKGAKGRRAARPAAASAEMSIARPATAAAGDEAKPHHRALRGALVELHFMRHHGAPSNKHDEVMRELTEAIGG